MDWGNGLRLRVGRALAERTRQAGATLLRLGLAAIVGFGVVRAINIYGDPRPWAAQTSSIGTVLSFLDCTKYPPSLLFLLMTLGPSILLLAAFDRQLGAVSRPFITIGRVPLFLYLLHLPLIHGLAVVFAYLRHGYAGAIWNGPVFASDASGFPSGYDYGLMGVYAMWIIVVALLYALCRWSAALKQRRRDAWLSYF